MKSMVRYEEVASDPTAVWRIVSARQEVMKASYKTDGLLCQMGDLQKQLTGLEESMNRMEILVQRIVNSQRRTTEPAWGRYTSEGNFNSPPTGYSVVVTGWGDDQFPHAFTASPTLNNLNPSHSPEMARDLESGFSAVAKKQAQNAMVGQNMNLITAAREARGVSEEVVSEQGERSNHPITISYPFIHNLPKDIMPADLDWSIDDKRLRCTGLFWKLPPWPDFCAMSGDSFAQHCGYKGFCGHKCKHTIGFIELKQNLAVVPTNSTLIHEVKLVSTVKDKESVCARAMNDTGSLLVTGDTERVVRIWDPGSKSKDMKWGRIETSGHMLSFNVVTEDNVEIVSPQAEAERQLMQISVKIPSIGKNIKLNVKKSNSAVDDKKGTVAFPVDLHGWAFTLSSFAKMYASKLQSVRHIIYIEDEPVEADTLMQMEHLTTLSFSEVEEFGKTSHTDAKLPSSTDTAVIMYTSGSIGLPKGVMITPGDMVATTAAVMAIVPKIGMKVHSLTMERVTNGSQVGILHSIDRNGTVYVGLIGLDTFWKGGYSDLQVAEAYCVGQFVRLEVNISNPHSEWQRKSGGGFSTDRISQILPNGCLVVKFTDKFSLGEVCSCLADPYEVEVVSFGKCEGIVKKYEHLEDFHWAVRLLLITMDLFNAVIEAIDGMRVALGAAVIWNYCNCPKELDNHNSPKYLDSRKSQTELDSTEEGELAAAIHTDFLYEKFNMRVSGKDTLVMTSGTGVYHLTVQG